MNSRIRRLIFVLLLAGFSGLACSAAPSAAPSPIDSVEGLVSDATDARSVAVVDVSGAPADVASPGDRADPEIVVASGTVFRSARLAETGGSVDIRVVDGRIVELGEVEAGPEDVIVDLGERFITPSFIDSHVHFSYRPGAEAMADGGIVAAIDHASPVEAFDEPAGPVALLRAGPMITASAGYPTQGWGANGYGLECATAACATAAVADLHGLGAGFIKVPFDSGPALTDDQVGAIIAAAHERGLVVSAHALLEADAVRAADLGADLLAHTPVSALPEAEFGRWAGKPVISTLGAFGGSADAVANLASLRAAGAIVLYGTDYGNTSRTGVDPVEISLLQSAGLDGAAIIEAGTRAPADFWGFEDFGSISVGKSASFIVTCSDPRTDPAALSRPAAVWLSGVERMTAACQ